MTRKGSRTRLSAAQQERAAGVLVGQACGDALGVPYEFGSPPRDGRPEIIGGGLGGHAPGEWSDDTQMAICIAEVAATGADLTTPEALDAIASRFEEWYASGPADIGNQTRAVLGLAGRLSASPAQRLREAARQVPERTGLSAGNGELTRTSPVALAHLFDSDEAAVAAREIAELTHHDPLAGDSCVLWTDLIRRAVLDGQTLGGDPTLIPEERRDYWAGLVAEAADSPPETFVPNGDTMRPSPVARSAVFVDSGPSPPRGSRASTAGPATGPTTSSASPTTSWACGRARAVGRVR